MKTIKYIYALATIVLVGACTNADIKYQYPKSAEEKRQESTGSFVSDKPEGGFTLFGKGSVLDRKETATSKSAGAMSVNSYLWQAALDTLQFMPILSSDSAGGVLATDWYEDPNAPGQKFRINAVIVGTELKVNAVRVTVFKQVYDPKSSTWHEVQVSDKIATELEDKILTRARQLRISREDQG